MTKFPLATWQHTGIISIGLSILSVLAWDSSAPVKTKTVTVTAYNSDVRQTDSTPYEPACGGDLRDGMPSIAVSKDLWKQGLQCGQMVLVGTTLYTVRDVMHARWRNRVDIYAGDDKQAAHTFGKQTLQISWRDV